MKSLRKNLAPALLAMVLLVTTAAQAAEFEIDPAHSSVRFQIKHLAISKVNGTFGDVSGSFNFTADHPDEWTAKAEIGIASIDTGNDKRDNHLRSDEFFDAAQFPKMTFVSTKVEMMGKQDGVLSGDLTMRGITRPIQLALEFNGEVTDPWGNERAGFSLSGQINRKDWGLTYNSTLESGGLVIGETVKITLEVEGIKAQ